MAWGLINSSGISPSRCPNGSRRMLTDRRPLIHRIILFPTAMTMSINTLMVTITMIMVTVMNTIITPPWITSPMW